MAAVQALARRVSCRETRTVTSQHGSSRTRLRPSEQARRPLRSPQASSRPDCGLVIPFQLSTMQAAAGLVLLVGASRLAYHILE